MLHVEWMDSAACRGMPLDMFFPETNNGGAAAKQVCRACPVSEECLEYALANNIRHGIWAGLSENDLRKLKSERRLPSGGWPVQCVECGRTFEAGHSAALLCSRDCERSRDAKRDRRRKLERNARQVAL